MYCIVHESACESENIFDILKAISSLYHKREKAFWVDTDDAKLFQRST